MNNEMYCLLEFKKRDLKQVSIASYSFYLQYFYMYCNARNFFQAFFKETFVNYKSSYLALKSINSEYILKSIILHINIRLNTWYNLPYYYYHCCCLVHYHQHPTNALSCYHFYNYYHHCCVSFLSSFLSWPTLLFTLLFRS